MIHTHRPLLVRELNVKGDKQVALHVLVLIMRHPLPSKADRVLWPNDLSPGHRHLDPSPVQVGKDNSGES